MRFVISGGGTGGHINPALAIANKIKQHHPNAEFLFIGAPYGMEKNLVPKEGYEIKFVKVKGFNRSLTLKNIDAIIKAFTSIGAAKKIIKDFAPDAVIGTGGYVSWSALKAASMLKIPTLIHEQNAYPGVTTNMLSKCVDKVCISFEESRRFFNEKAKTKLVFTGNPIKTDKFKKTREEARKELDLPEDVPYILSCGGSLGAANVNEYVIDMMDKFVKNTRIRHIHATGSRGYEKYSAIAKEKGLDKYENIKILEYIYDMETQMAAADIVIGRAGAITLAELAYLGKASLLIPSPNVTEDHQYKNAMVFANGGAAIVKRENEWNGEELTKCVKELMDNKEKLISLGENAKKFASSNADELIYQEVMKLIKK